MLRLLALLTACLALLAVGCGEDEEPAATPAPTEAAANEFLPEGCEDVEKPAPKDVGTIEKPDEKLSGSKTYIATVSTSCGDFEIQLDSKQAPITGGAFKYLADQKFFDGTTFHRIVADFVIQGGDPAGDGTGGPGFTVVEAPPSDLTYDEGIVAMAKAPDEPPGASGSQFFVVTGAGATSLPPEYALLGKVTKGMEVATKIGAIQADANGVPAAPVVIKSITVKEA